VEPHRIRISAVASTAIETLVYNTSMRDEQVRGVIHGRQADLMLATGAILLRSARAELKLRPQDPSLPSSGAVVPLRRLRPASLSNLDHLQQSQQGVELILTAS